MWFYALTGTIFMIYALDLTFLIIVSILSRGHQKELRKLSYPDSEAELYDESSSEDAAPSGPIGSSAATKDGKPPPPRLPKGAESALESAEYYHKYPKVLIQLPMYNEEAHCEAVIQCCCNIRYPRDRLLIQVLDDSTKEHIKKQVDACAASMVEMGHPVQVMRRPNRNGYKAGGLVHGLNRVEGQGFEHVVIFDADFEPPADFLMHTVPHLVKDPKVGFVQTRWSFVNTDTFLTWCQKINLGFHFDYEQRARSYLGQYFNFNGTAGVWRIEAINDIGGWSTDTVVEDMDLSLRAHLKGWKSVYLDYVNNPNELPSTLSGYKTQQFRWLAGPMQILVTCYGKVWRAQGISLGQKLNCFWFFTRYVHFAILTFVVLLVPPMQMFVDKFQWDWAGIYFVCAINYAIIVYMVVTPFSIAYLLFSVATGYFKAYAMFAGLIGTKKSKSWTVTQKFGNKGKLHKFHPPYALEFILALYYAAFCVLAAVMFADWMMTGYCALMTLCFLAVSFGDYWM